MSAPAALTVNSSPTLSKSAATLLNVSHGGRMPDSPTEKRTLRESPVRPLAFVATAYTE